MGDEFKTSLLLDLVDHISGPAKSVTGSLKTVQTEIKATRDAAGRMRDELGRFVATGAGAAAQQKYFRDSAGRLRDELGRFVGTGRSATGQTGALKNEVEAASSSFSALGKLAGYAAIGVGAVAAAGAGIGYASYEFMQYTTAAASFREDTEATLTVLLKSKAAAQDFMSTLTRLAAVTPFETKEVMKFGTQLVGAGFSASDIPALLKSAGDLATISSSMMSRPETVRHLLAYISRIQTQGYMSGEVRQGLEGLGMPMADIYTAMQKQTGLKSIDEVKTALEKKRIGADLAITSIMQAGIGKFGGLGRGMDIQSGTLSGIWSTLASKPFEFAMTAMDSPGFSIIKRTISDLNKALEDPKITAGITSRLNQVYSFIASTVFGDMNQANMTGFVDRLLRGFDKVFGYVQIGTAGLKGIFEGVFSGLSAGLKLPDELNAESIAYLSGQWRESGRQIGTSIGQIGAALANVAVHGQEFSGTFRLIATSLETIAKPFAAINQQMERFGEIVNSPLGQAISGIAPQVFNQMFPGSGWLYESVRSPEEVRRQRMEGPSIAPVIHMPVTITEAKDPAETQSAIEKASRAATESMADQLKELGFVGGQ